MTITAIAMKNTVEREKAFEHIPRSLATYERFIERNISKRVASTEEALAEPVDEDRVLLRVTDPDALAAFQQVDVAFIEAGALDDLLKLAVGRLRLAQETVMQLIREREDVDPGGKWSVDHARRLVLGPADEGDNEGLAALVEICETLVRLDQEALEGIQSGAFPDGWKEAIGVIPGTESFLSDLAEFLVEAGDAGTKIVGAILGDEAVTCRAAVDQKLPKPVRMLVQIAVKARQKEDK